MTNEKLQSAFFYHRSNGIEADSALQFAREDVAKGRERYSYSYPKPLTEGWGNARRDGAVWIESLAAAGLRFVDYADKLARIGHNGWYTEDDGDNGELMRGVVVRMSARNGASRYLPGYECPNNPCTYRIDVSAIYSESDDDERAQRECARAADSFAEHAAESERDYNRAWQAGRRYEDLAEEITTTRRGLIELIRDAKATCKQSRFPDSIRTVIGFRIKEGLADIRKARKERGELFSDYGRQPGWEG